MSNFIISLENQNSVFKVTPILINYSTQLIYNSCFHITYDID